jgi:hypothetical protein
MKRNSTCKYCSAGFRAVHKGNGNWTECCSKSCGMKYHWQQKASNYKFQNGNINHAGALKVIRALTNAGFLTKTTIDEALRRTTDRIEKVE